MSSLAAPQCAAVLPVKTATATAPRSSQRTYLVKSNAIASRGSSFFARKVQPGATATRAMPRRCSALRVSAVSKRPKANAVAVDGVEVGTDAMTEFVKSKGGNRPIRKILIANNGMAAAKCILSMRRWAYLTLGDGDAISFVAMATPEDLAANAEFIRQADDFIEVSPRCWKIRGDMAL
mmetsp:Transcript_14865/g.35405  ORF Transcript_14865/g.35405 Transcript_14865/m.35405 type:complete len:179 (-) Transcript_14865:61-597(-)